MAIADTQHLGTVSVIAPALPPQVGGLQRRHQKFDRAGLVLLLANDLLDLVQDLQAQRQPGVDSRGGLADQARAKHQLVADDLGVRRAFLQDGQKGL